MAKNSDGRPASRRAAPKRVRITKTVVDALRPELWPYRIWDTALAGFGVYVLPSGVATYMLKFRTGAGRQRWQTLGRVGILAPDEARAKARAMLVARDK